MVRSELRARIAAETGPYRRGMREISQLSAATAGKIAAAFAGVLSARAIGSQMRELAAYGDAIDKAAKRTGLTAEAVQRLGHAARVAGADFGAIEKGVKGAARIVTDANDGLGEAIRTLDRLGVSAAALRDMTPEQQFRAMMESLAAMSNVTDRTATAVEVFGRSGMALLPMLEGGAAGFRELAAEADKFGVLTAKDIDAAVRFTDAMTRLKTASAAVRGALAAEAMAAFADQVESAARKVAALQRSGDLAKWGKDIADAVGAAAAAITTLSKAVVEHKAELKVMLASYAGWKVLTVAHAAVVAMTGGLARLGAAMAADTAMTTANTAAVARNAAARKEAAAVIAESSIGINAASTATVAFANGAAGASTTLTRFGAVLSGVKWLGYIALAVKTTATMWELARAVGEVGDAMDRVGAKDRRPWWQRALDYTPEWMGGGPEGQRVEIAAPNRWRVANERAARWKRLGERKSQPVPDEDTIATTAAKQAEKAADEQAKQLADMYEKLRSAARQGRLTGDRAAVEVFRILTGGRRIDVPADAFGIAALFKRLEATLPGDPEGALAVVRDRVSKTLSAVRSELEAADQKQRRTIEDAIERERTMRERMARLSSDQYIANMRDRAERMEARGERYAAASAEHLRQASLPKSERDAERRAARAAEREERLRDRRAHRALENYENGAPVSRRGRELLLGANMAALARGSRDSADRLRKQADMAALRLSMEPVVGAVGRVEKILDTRLPGDKT